MTEEEILSKSQKLTGLFISSDAYMQARTIYGYLSYNQEVRTEQILMQAILDGKQVAVPKIIDNEMVFIYISDLSLVEKGYKGIPEPIVNAPVANDPSALVLMPGLAFDKNGGRMGYGGGFYDRFLSKEQNHKTVALCYDFQIVEDLPVEEFDIPVDLVIWA
jgi:5-formyltetrahydrofolate cyclo-ligase